MRSPRADIDPARAPSAWRPLFECRRQRGIRAIQFALAGMNAHINRDLPEGIVMSYQGCGRRTRGRAARRHADFDKVNDLLEAVETQIKDRVFNRPRDARRCRLLARSMMRSPCGRCGRRAQRHGRTREVLWALRPTPTLRQGVLFAARQFHRFRRDAVFCCRRHRLSIGKRGVYADDRRVRVLPVDVRRGRRDGVRR